MEGGLIRRRKKCGLIAPHPPTLISVSFDANTFSWRKRRRRRRKS